MSYMQPSEELLRDPRRKLLRTGIRMMHSDTVIREQVRLHAGPVLLFGAVELLAGMAVMEKRRL